MPAYGHGGGKGRTTWLTRPGDVARSSPCRGRVRAVQAGVEVESGTHISTPPGPYAQASCRARPRMPTTACARSSPLPITSPRGVAAADGDHRTANRAELKWGDPGFSLCKSGYCIAGPSLAPKPWGAPRRPRRPRARCPAPTARHHRPQTARGGPDLRTGPLHRPPRPATAPPLRLAHLLSIGMRNSNFLNETAPAGSHTLAVPRIACDPGRRPKRHTTAGPAPPTPAYLPFHRFRRVLHAWPCCEGFDRYQFLPPRFSLSQFLGSRFRPLPGSLRPPGPAPIYISAGVRAPPLAPQLASRSAMAMAHALRAKIEAGSCCISISQ